MKRIEGQFTVELDFEPAFDEVEGVMLARATGKKQFLGALSATSQVWMMSAMGGRQGKAYVAMERIDGELEGKAGTFVAVHLGVHSAQGDSLVLRVVPDSGTGELESLSGEMQIEVVEGKHYYVFEYEL